LALVYAYIISYKFTLPEIFGIIILHDGITNNIQC